MRWLAALLLLGVAQAEELPFAPTSVDPVAIDPGFTTAGDVDGDGDLDLVVSSENGDYVAWYANDGAGGTWTRTVIADPGGEPLDPQLGDVDGDGDLDVAAAAVGDGDVVWFENTEGDGSLWTTHTVAPLGDVVSVRLADIAGDGSLDIVALDEGAGGLVWYSNTAGDGSAWTPATIDVDPDGGLCVGDIDGDGDVDVAAGSADNDLFSWYANSGDGSGWIERVVANPGAPRACVSVDLDRDGDLDLALTDTDGAFDSLVLFANTAGDGSSWTPQTVSAVLPDALFLQAVDLDFDGDVDLVSGSESGDEVAWFENSPPGWTEHVTLGVDGPRSAAIGDLDRDGDLDLAAPGADGGEVVWLDNQRVHGAIDYGAAVAFNAEPLTPISLELADVDGDGALDVLLGSTDSIHRVSWMSNNAGDASDWTWNIIDDSGLSTPRRVGAADLDSDGDLDFVMISQVNSTYGWYENEDGVGGSWSARLPIHDGSPSARVPRDMALADLDRDGDTDFIAPSFRDDKLMWWANEDPPSGNWPDTEIATGLPDIQHIDVGDLDGDGDLDIAGTTSVPNTIWVENTDGVGGAWTVHVIEDALLQPVSQMFFFDPDQDGDLDLVRYKSSTGLAWLENRLATGEDWVEHELDSGNAFGGIRAADVDYDGDPDLVMTRDGGLQFQLNDGTGLNWTEVNVQSGFDQKLRIGDVNGDGLHNIVTVDPANDAFDQHEVLMWTPTQQQASLTSANVNQSELEETLSVEVLSLDLAHTFGLASDTDIELAELALRFGDDGGLDYEQADLESLLGAVSIWRDDGDDSFSAADDTMVVELTSLPAVNGELVVSLPDGSSDAAVAAGTSGRFFVVLTASADAATAPLSVLVVEHVPSLGTVVDHAGTDVPVLALGTPNEASEELGFALRDSDADGDPDVTDCDDGDDAIYTGAPEVCDAVDSDCDDSLVDTGPNADAASGDDFDGDLEPDCVDLDDDEDGDPDLTDCDDFDAAVFTGQTEVCDAIDSDCDDSFADEFDDHDGDDDPDCNDPNDDNDLSPDLDDCEPFDPTIFPGQDEFCDAIDSDCDGSLVDEFEDFDGDLDPDCTDPDDDNDGSLDEDDCNDFDPAINPDAHEACDDIDSNCDGSIVDGDDFDGDLIPDCTDEDDDDDGSLDVDDCDDFDAAVFPGQTELCDAVDSDCDGSVADDFDDLDGDDDPDCNDPDDDGDGSDDGDDCAPLDATIHPGAAELCDAIDQDCDGSLVDEDADTDGDLEPDCTDEDDDADGLPDTWELDHGLDPLDFSDAAQDGDADGRDNTTEFAGGTDPDSYDGPGLALPSLPEDGQFTDQVSPVLQALSAVSPTEEVLTYTFEVYADEALTDLVASAADVPEPETDLPNWAVDVALDEDATFWWRVAASDPWVTGAFSEAFSFVVDAVGEEPTVPTPLFPVTGQTMLFGDEVLSWAESVSPEGLDIEYLVELLDADGLVVLDDDVVPDDADSDVEAWVPAFELVPGSTYSWRVRATDPVGRSSVFTAVQVFGYVTTNAAPSDPVFTSPLDGDGVSGVSPVFVVTESEDPEGGAVMHRFALDSTDSFDSADLMELEAPGTNTGELSFDLADEGVELDTEQTWYARIDAVDVDGQVSAEDVIAIFVRGENDAPPTPDQLAPRVREVTVKKPELVASEVEDPEGDAVTYEWRVATDRALAEVVAAGATDEPTWTVDVDLAGGHFWSVRALDEEGAASDWSPVRYLLAQDPSWGTCSTGGRGGGLIGLLLLLALRRRRSI